MFFKLFFLTFFWSGISPSNFLPKSDLILTSQIILVADFCPGAEKKLQILPFIAKFLHIFYFQFPPFFTNEIS